MDSMARQQPSGAAGYPLRTTSGSHRQPEPEPVAVGAPQAAYTPEQFTQPFCDFMTQSPTPFHVVDYCESRFRASGFQQVRMHRHETQACAQ